MLNNNTILSIVVCLASMSVASGALTTTSTTLLTNTQPNPAAPSALIDLTNGSATASGTSLPLPGGLTLGDGTVEEYLFVNAVGVSDAAAGSLNVYASSTSNITTPTFPTATLGGSDLFASVTLPDGTTQFTTNTAARASDVSFSVDTAPYLSGTVYVVFGTFVDFNQVSVTDGTNTLISGFLGSEDSGDAFDTTGTAFDFSGTTLANVGTAIAAFDFDNSSGTGTSLDFRQINTDLDGSRARFYGVIVDGTLVPEPSSTALLGLGALGLLIRRKR